MINKYRSDDFLLVRIFLHRIIFTIKYEYILYNINAMYLFYKMYRKNECIIFKNVLMLNLNTFNILIILL